MSVHFVITESQQSVIKATGLPLDGFVMEHCALAVGDIFSHPASPGLFWRVVSRWLQLGTDEKEPAWFLTVEPAHHPLRNR